MGKYGARASKTTSVPEASTALSSLAAQLRPRTRQRGSFSPAMAAAKPRPTSSASVGDASPASNSRHSRSAPYTPDASKSATPSTASMRSQARCRVFCACAGIWTSPPSTALAASCATPSPTPRASSAERTRSDDAAEGASAHRAATNAATTARSFDVSPVHAPRASSSKTMARQMLARARTFASSLRRCSPSSAGLRSAATVVNAALRLSNAAKCWPSSRDASQNAAHGDISGAGDSAASRFDRNQSMLRV
mmetsp:Transcript_13838/g.46140  ORF Transcript_13838/g.46140 Transcript_13838/m.46140 type:complete len:252 (-) Transcript_13838:283-1038(-)